MLGLQIHNVPEAAVVLTGSVPNICEYYRFAVIGRCVSRRGSNCAGTLQVVVVEAIPVLLDMTLGENLMLGVSSETGLTVQPDVMWDTAEQCCLDKYYSKRSEFMVRDPRTSF